VGDRPVSPALDRLTLVDAALVDVDGLEASRLEIDRGGPSYTVDTIEELRRLEPTADLYLIVGADVIAGLATWERLDDVRREATMVVVNRPGSTPVLPGQDGPLAGWNAVAIEIPALEISSTDLRERAATGRPLDYLIPEGAVRMIKERGMYARDR